MMKFGIMGAGSIAAKFCGAAAVTADAEVAAVSSKSEERARTFAEKNGVPSWYGNYDEMLSREDIEAVYIATTHNFHFDNIMLALSRGKHVLCEKCMVLTAEQARTVFEESARRGLFVMECMWSRFTPAFRRAVEWIAEGRIGRVISATYKFGFDTPAGNRVIDPALAGGALYDIGVYAIEGLMALIGGEVTAVRSTLCFENGVDVTDSIALTINGSIATAFVSVKSPMVGTEAFVYGEKGRVWLPNPVDAQKVELQLTDGTVETYEKKHDNGFVFELRAALDAITAGKRECCVIPHTDTLRCAEIFDSCMKDNK